MRYLKNAIFIAIIIAVAIKMFGSGTTMNLSVDSEASPLPPGISRVSAADLAKDIIDSPTSAPTFLIVYASWCPYCKRQFPLIEKLAALYSGKINFITLSIDRNPQAVGNFLASRKGAGRDFKAYVYGGGDTSILIQKLRHMGLEFNGGVPFMALFDGRGKLLAQFRGLTDKQTLERQIKQSFTADSD